MENKIMTKRLFLLMGLVSLTSGAALAREPEGAIEFINEVSVKMRPFDGAVMSVDGKQYAIKPSDVVTVDVNAGIPVPVSMINYIFDGDQIDKHFIDQSCRDLKIMVQESQTVSIRIKGTISGTGLSHIFCE